MVFLSFFHINHHLVSLNSPRHLGISDLLLDKQIQRQVNTNSNYDNESKNSGSKEDEVPPELTHLEQLVLERERRHVVKCLANHNYMLVSWKSHFVEGIGKVVLGSAIFIPDDVFKTIAHVDLDEVVRQICRRAHRHIEGNRELL